eukprot:Skav214808  [mRNA]  locus=scaffold1934:111:836:+ [translate_table: standard]
MGKGGYGKGWRSQPWQRQQHHRNWQSDRRWQQGHSHGYSYGSHAVPPEQSSLNQLCCGVVSSAWEGVCSGVATAAWKAVEGTAGLLLKSYQTDKKSVSATAQGMMACLAGKSEEPTCEPAPAPSATQSDETGQSADKKLVLSVLELQKEQMQQNSFLQKQLLEMCNANGAKTAEPIRKSQAEGKVRSRQPRASTAAKQGRAKDPKPLKRRLGAAKSLKKKGKPATRAPTEKDRRSGGKKPE